MKKVIIITLMIMLIILTGLITIKGISLGGLSILSVSQLNKKNDELNLSLKSATKLASTDYEKNISDLNDKIKELDSKRTEYEDKINVSTENQLNGINSINQPYKIEYLWVIIGNHAKTEGVEIKMDVSKSTSGTEDYYNLNFTVTGMYISISEFITDVEDDSSLGFKIENFKMNSTQQQSKETQNNTVNTQPNVETLQATFVCKDVKIQGISSSSAQIKTDTEQNNTTTNTTENEVQNQNQVTNSKDNTTN